MSKVFPFPTPAASRALERGVRVVPAAGVLRGDPPRHLGKLARECWRLIVAEQGALAESGLAWITRSDGLAIELVCVAYARWREADKALENSIVSLRRQAVGRLIHEGLSRKWALERARREVSGTMLTSKSGDLIPSPFIAAELAQRRALSAALREAGFSPGVRLALLAKLIRIEVPQGSGPAVDDVDRSLLA